MRLFAAFLSLYVLLPSTVMAQQNSDTQQILEMLKGINGRFDTIEKRLDNVEGQTQAPDPVVTQPPPAPANNSTAAATSTPPAGKAVPGWKIGVFPLTEEGVAAAPIARVKAPIGITYFNLHFENGPVSNLVNYHGEAYFWAKVDGDYTFNIGIDNTRARNDSLWSCDASLNVEDKNVIEKFGSNQPRAMSGNIQLSQGKYLISYDVKCFQRHNNGSYTMSRREVEESYKKLSFNVSVLAPNDDKLRDFDPDELFFIAPPQRPQPDKRSDIEPSPNGTVDYQEDQPRRAEVQPSLPVQPVAIDMFQDGITTRSANFRVGPSKDSESRVELPAQFPVRVVQQVGSWYKVQLRSGDTGFIHSSIIALRVR